MLEPSAENDSAFIHSSVARLYIWDREAFVVGESFGFCIRFRLNDFSMWKSIDKETLAYDAALDQSSVAIQNVNSGVSA